MINKIKQFFITGFMKEKLLFFTMKYSFILLLVTSMNVYAQQGITITGTVSDNGDPLPGVNITVKGTSTGVMTDTNGKYSITVSNTNAVLQFSYVGYVSQEFVIGDKRSINVTLIEDSHLLEEVVVVGYGTQKKVNLTGAVGVVSSEKLENRPIASSGHGLQGLIPGMNVTIADGDPTTASTFNIRGYTSINGGSPLILVDGISMDLNMINPSDIASVVVLKDAAASAIYGSRAGFGVILVETKKGENKKAVVTISTEQSWAKSIFHYNPVTDPYEFMVWRNKANVRTAGTVQFSEARLERAQRWNENPTLENAWYITSTGSLEYNGYSDYKHKLMNDFAPQQKYNLSVSKATDDASLYVSFGYLNKDGFLKLANETYQRYNILMKSDIKIKPWLLLDSKIVFNAEDSDKPHAYGVSNVAGLHSVARVNTLQPLEFPDLPYYLEPGDREKYEPYIGMGFYNGDMIPNLKQGGRTKYFRGDLYLTQGITLMPLKGLKIRGDFTFRPTFNNYSDVQSQVNLTTANLMANDMIVPNNNSVPEFIENRNTYTKNYELNTYAEYEMTQFRKHYLKAMAGFSQEWMLYQYNRARANDMMSSNLTTINLTTGAQQTGGSANHYALRGTFFRINYIYDDRYLVELNGRYDGTSRFRKDSRFGFFPSASVGWRVSEEPFMKGGSNWLDNLKIRLSYGELGNQAIGGNYYPYINSMSAGTSTYRMDGSSSLLPTIAPPSLAASTLTWEKVLSRNLGLDLTVLKQRLDVTFDVYTRDTKGMLMRVSYPDILGADAPLENGADLRTKGWDFSATWRDRIGKDWRYELTLALWDSQSEITEYYNPTGSLSTWRKGQKTGEIWGYVTEGIFQYDDEVDKHADQAVIGTDWRAGDMKYADLDGDGRITAGENTESNPGDRKIIGNSTARYSFSIYPKVSYQNWSLDVFFQGVMKQDFMPSGSSWTNFFPFVSTAYIDKSWLKNTWSEDNRDAYFFAPYNANTTNKNTIAQSRFVQNSAYIRLKTLTLSYRIPSVWTEKIGISNAQVYLAGMNLWEYTKMRKPYDPENTSATILYPLQRIFSVGFKVTL